MKIRRKNLYLVWLVFEDIRCYCAWVDDPLFALALLCCIRQARSPLCHLTFVCVCIKRRNISTVRRHICSDLLYVRYNKSKRWVVKVRWVCSHLMLNYLILLWVQRIFDSFSNPNFEGVFRIAVDFGDCCAGSIGIRWTTETFSSFGSLAS